MEVDPLAAYLKRGVILKAMGATLVLGSGAVPAVAAASALRVGMIPDAGATQGSTDEKAPLRDYLSAKMGQPIELVIPTNYNATVEGLGNGSRRFGGRGGAPVP